MSFNSITTAQLFMHLSSYGSSFFLTGRIILAHSLCTFLNPSQATFFFFFNSSSFSNISQPRLSLSRYGHGSHEWPRAITATLKWCLLAEILNLKCTTVCSIWLWNLPASRCAGAGILNIFSIMCDSQRPPIPATYFKFRLGLTNHHISLRSKRFLLVSEQRKTEAQDFRFWPRENGFTIRINGNSQVALFFAILLLRLCFFVLLLLIPSLF